MAIYRGAGGAGDAVNDSSSEASITVIARDAALAAQAAAEAAQTAAELAETNAETAETNAETAETNAETAATNAASSASSASTSATNAASSASSASTSATNAASSASSASTSATNAASSASSASSSASSASTSASNAATSATAAQAAQAAAEAAFDAFDDIYLGAKSSNPTVDNDGNALTTGDQYFNTVSNEMRVWNGSTWQSASVIGGTVTTLSVTGNTTLGDASTDTVTVNANNITTPNGIAINGTTIPASKTLVVTTDIGSTVQAYDANTAKLNAAQSWSAAQSFNAGVTLGDASGDALTINSSAVSIPNGLNFDSNTLVIDATNNRVGVGIASPAYPLDINGNIGIKFSGSTAAVLWNDSNAFNIQAGSVASAGLKIGTSGDTPLVSYTNNTERMRVTGTGNVGIGTSSPNSLLDVAGTISIGGKSTLNTTGANTVNIGGIANNGLQTLNFYTNTTGNIATLRATLDSSGNLGIGTSSPSYKLHVVQSSGVAAGFDRADGSSAIIDLRTSGATRGYLGASTSVPFIVYNASPTELMRLDSSGNLGLGVTPSAWLSSYKVIDFTGGSIQGGTTGDLQFYQNAYRNASGNNVYRNTAAASMLDIGSGGYYFYTAPSGTAGTTFSWSNTAYIGTSGFSVGGLSPDTFARGYNTNISVTSTGIAAIGVKSATGNNAYIDLGVNTSRTGSLYTTGSQLSLAAIGALPITFETNGNERMRIDSSGNVGIGTSSNSYTAAGRGNLNIAGSSSAILGFQIGGSAKGYYFHNGTDLQMWNEVAGANIFGTNALERMRIDSSGNVGIGTSSPTSFGAGATMLTVAGTSAYGGYLATTTSVTGQLWSNESGLSVSVGSRTNHPLLITTNNTERMRIDSSGNLGLGVTPSAWNTAVAFAVGNGALTGTVQSGSLDLANNVYFNGSSYLYRSTNYATFYRQTVGGAHLWYQAPSGTAGAVASFTQAMTLDASGNLGIGETSPNTKLHANGDIRSTNASTNFSRFSFGQYGSSGTSYTFIQGDARSSGYMAFYTNVTEAMRIDSSGNLLVGTTSGSNHIFLKNVSVGSAILGITNSGQNTAIFYATDDTGNSTANAGLWIRKVAATNRSINAAGTVNASGADYAEYMTKASDFIIAKGDVVGIDANGKLTNVFTDAISFCVKSTDPSYVGGDVWFTEDKPEDESLIEDWENRLEQARQTVDRIAFAGQVPVNVLGATAGQYIVPVNDNGTIKGQAVSNPTFEQYQIAVGKVIAIEQDGRAKIIVKVA